MDKCDWKVGLSKAKITPDEPMPMAGYAHRTELSDGVNSDLYLKALALEDLEGTQSVLITADFLGFSDVDATEICNRIGEKTGLPREAILLNPSHTHSGPVSVSVNAARNPETKDVVLNYVNRVIEASVSAAEEALDSLEPARLSWGTGVVHFVMNRREFTDQGVKLGVNPRGLADRSVPVMRIDGENGELKAVLFGAAGHNVTNNSRWLKIDGEWAGFAQKNIESANPGVQAMFVLGCAGDANIYPQGSNEISQEHGESLSNEVFRVLDSELAPVRGPIRMAFERVDLQLQTFNSREDIEALNAKARYQRYFAEQALEILDRGESLPETFNAPFAMWQFGDDLTLLGLSGEVLVDYVILAERTIGPLRLWVAGYCNSLFGYLPTPRVLEEGGYETRGLYLGVGLFAPEAFEQVRRVIELLANRVGRPSD